TSKTPNTLCSRTMTPPCESVALVFVCSVPEHPCSTPRGASVKGPRPQRWHGKKLVAGERLSVAAPHQRADRGGHRAYVGPPALVGVGAGGERGLREERDRAAQVRKPDDLGHEAVVLLGLVVIVHVRQRDRRRDPSQPHKGRRFAGTAGEEGALRRDALLRDAFAGHAQEPLALVAEGVVHVAGPHPWARRG